MTSLPDALQLVSSSKIDLHGLLSAHFLLLGNKSGENLAFATIEDLYNHTVYGADPR